MNMIEIPSGMETKYFVMSKGALQDVPELVKTAFPGKKVFLIADENTWNAAGKKVYEFLKRADIPMYEPHVFPGSPKLHPDYAISQKLAEKMNAQTAPVVVGSGVLNDLTKCASGIAKIPYCCVATAASVDGYTSYGGAMSVNGMKKTVPCPAPYALLADLDVLANAPKEMLASGYADLLTKVPAGADWLIAETLGIEPVVQNVWDLVQKDLRAWVADTTNLYNIFMGLSATGYSMQMYRDSRPASGGEHMCSHVWEMEKLMYNGEEISHGFKVGIGTIAVVQLMEFILNTPVEKARALARPLYTLEERKAQIAELLKRDCYGTGIPEVALAKFQSGEAGKQRQELIFANWETIRAKLRGQLFPLEEFIRLLKKAGAPVDYQEIGLSREQYLHGIRTAQLIRKRYVVFDMLYESGLFETALENLR